ALDNAPITVLLAVLPSPCESQVHGPRFYAQTKTRKERRSSLQAFSPQRPLIRFRFCRQNSKISGPVGKVGLVRRSSVRRSGPRRASLRRSILRGSSLLSVIHRHSRWRLARTREMALLQCVSFRATF